MRVVIDTNVLVSGLLVKGSPADAVRHGWERGAFELVTSEWQLDEIRRVSRYPRLAKRVRPHEFGRLVGRMRRSALAGGAEWLVTGDAGHLSSLGNVGGIAIVSPSAFLEAVGV